ncbi:hypothetical protein [Vibrio harveyi]|uniref:hypothetical protein n=1 Tax=Vibrio harveyi TaxID=669 RepID=UPI004069625A
MKYITEFKDRMVKSENLIKEDAHLLEQLLGADKSFVNSLYDYYLSNDTFTECFKDFADLENCFTGTDIFRFEENKEGIEKNLYGSWIFQPGIYNHLKHRFFGDIRIEVSRKEESVKNEKVIADLEHLNIKNYKIVDIEFFEFSDWDNQFDLSQKIKDSKLKIKDHKEFRDFIKHNHLHLEKEKIHFKFVVGVKDNKKVTLPLYIGIGTNEAYGLQIKMGQDKNRWFKLALDIDNPYKEEAYIKTVSTDKNMIKNLLDKQDWFCVTNEDSWSNGTVICTVINRAHIDYKERDNQALICFLKCNVANGAPSNPVAIVSPEYKNEQVSRFDIWSCFLRESYSVNEYLFDLIEKSQKDYQCFFELYNCPYRIISSFGTNKIAKVIGLKYEKILTFSDFSMIAKCVEWDNINTIAGDIYKLGIDSERNRISSLIVAFLLHNNQFNSIIDGQ